MNLYGIQHVVLAFSSAPHAVMLDLVARCETLGIRVSIVPRLFERMPSRVDVTHVGGLPLLHLRPANPHSTQYAIKYVLDRVFAIAALVILSPLLLAIALAVLVSLGRPIFYRQQRVGRDNSPFEMLKFRTMRPARPVGRYVGRPAAGHGARWSRGDGQALVGRFRAAPQFAR